MIFLSDNKIFSSEKVFCHMTKSIFKYQHFFLKCQTFYKVTKNVFSSDKFFFKRDKKFFKVTNPFFSSNTAFAPECLGAHYSLSSSSSSSWEFYSYQLIETSWSLSSSTIDLQVICSFCFLFVTKAAKYSGV